MIHTRLNVFLCLEIDPILFLSEYNNETHFREYLQADPGSHHIVDGGNHRSVNGSFSWNHLYTIAVMILILIFEL